MQCVSAWGRDELFEFWKGELPMLNCRRNFVLCKRDILVWEFFGRGILVALCARLSVLDAWNWVILSMMEIQRPVRD